MRLSRSIITITIILISILSFDKKLFSWGLFRLFRGTEYKSTQLKKALDFNPDRDILYLPALGGKDLFRSIEDLSICRKKEVRKYLYIYLTKGRNFVIKGISRSYIYFDILKNIFERNKDIPADIMLLPLLESGFSPFAVSKSKAAGLWQFLSSTSAPLGLKKNRWVDERRHIEKSTIAAIRHLKGLYGKFRSWELALMAYNGGGGYIERTIKKSGIKDPWELIESGLLREETRRYLPKYIALLLIYKNQRLFGIKDEIEIPQIIKTEKYTLKHPVRLKDISKFSDIPVDLIRKYNPELNRNITPPYHKNYKIRIPSDSVKKLMKNGKKLRRYGITHIKIHRTRKGETLSLIAGKYKKKQNFLYNLTV